MIEPRTVSGGWRLRVVGVLAAALAVAASIVIPRIDRAAPLFEPAAFSLGVPDGWRRCFSDLHQFTIAFPGDWTIANREAGVACQYADPRAFELDDGDPPKLSTAVRVMPQRYVAGTGALRSFRPYNYPDTLKALIDPRRWDVRTNKTVEVDGLPTRLVESVARDGGYYAKGTVLYAYVVSAGARHDRRCARFFVHCSPFVVSTRVAPSQRRELDALRSVTDEAVRTLRFYPQRWGHGRHEYVALECFLDAYVSGDREADPCRTNGFERSIDEDGREPVVRFTIRTLYGSEQGERRMIVRTYRGRGAADRFSDDVFTLRSDRRELPFDERSDLKWRVTSWEHGPEVAIERPRDVKVYLPARDACPRMFHPTREGLGKSFDPQALVVLTRAVPAMDVLPEEAVHEVLMGPSPRERRLAPSARSISPEGLRVSGGWIDGGRAMIGYGEEMAETECMRAITDLALSKTLRQFPEVRSVATSMTISD